MIGSFKDREAELVWRGEHSKRLPLDVQKTGLRKLMLLDAAKSLNDLKSPPANQLEALKRDRVGQWSIRINRQWRICFTWENGNAELVEIVDYH